LAQLGERLQVTPGQWAEWTAKAKAAATARKDDIDQLDFQKRLRDALAAAEAKGGRQGEVSAHKQRNKPSKQRSAGMQCGGGSSCRVWWQGLRLQCDMRQGKQGTKRVREEQKQKLQEREL
jgi:hypothetical protein